MNISDIIIPDDLLEDIKVFCKLIDTHDRIDEVVLNEEFADLIKPYSRKVTNGEYSTFAKSERSLYMVCTTPPPEILEIPDEDRGEFLIYYHFEEFDSWLNEEFKRFNFSTISSGTALCYLQEAYSSHNMDDCLHTMTLAELLGDITYLSRWYHINFASEEYMDIRRGLIRDHHKRFFLSTLIASVLPEFENVLWTGNNLLTKTYFCLWELTEEPLWLDTVTTDIIFEDIDGIGKIGECIIFLMEDRIIRFNMWVNRTIKKHDFPCYEILEFKDNHHIADLDVPASPEGFLVLKMMEI